jgi:hypothetical protein
MNLTKTTSFSIVISIVQFTHGLVEIHKSQFFLIALYSP